MLDTMKYYNRDKIWKIKKIKYDICPQGGSMAKHLKTL